MRRDGGLDVRDNPEDIGQHFGRHPSHLRDILADPEDLRVDGACSHQVECDVQELQQVAHGVAVPREVPLVEAAEGAHHARDVEPALDDVPVFARLLEIPAPAVFMEQAQALFFHQECLRVVCPEMLGEHVEVLVVQEELAAALELVGVALAEVARSAERREVLQHGRQYARIVLPLVVVEYGQALRRCARDVLRGICEQASASIFGEVEAVVDLLLENLVLDSRCPHEALLVGRVEVGLDGGAVLVVGEVEPVELEQERRVGACHFGNLEEGRGDVLARDGIAAVAAHLHVIAAVEQVDAALCEQELGGRVHRTVFERKHLGGLLF